MSPRVQAGAERAGNIVAGDRIRIVSPEGCFPWMKGLEVDVRRVMPNGALMFERGGADWFVRPDRVERVQSRSQRDAARSEFGSPPHDDRVLAVVLVVTGGDSGVGPRTYVLDPDSPHAEAFWQDAGRPWCGQRESAEATGPDICVPNPCPTGTATAEAARAWAFVCRTSGVDPEKWESFARYRGAVLPGRARLCIDIANRLNRASREHAREDLIERLGPLPEPIPRREP